MSAEQLVERKRPIDTPRYDVIVVGCGGWGLAVLKVLADLGLRVLGIERREICHNLRHYMKRMVMHSRLSYMVLDPDDAILAQKGETHHPLIEELIQSYSDFAVKFDLPIKTHHELVDIEGSRDNFALTVRDPEDRTVRLAANRVVLATGSFDNPNLAGIPGELDAAVHHYFHEWEHIKGKKVLFIGGGFSSADGIIALCQRNTILWAVRKSSDEVDQMLTDQKTIWGQPDARLVNTEIWPESQVLSLENNTAVVQTPCGRKSWRYDLCYMLIGHRPNQELCARLLNGNLAFDDETFESCARPGVYLVGALAKKHLEHIGLTDILCPDNQGIRYIERIRSAMQQEFNCAER
ncbi:MAG: NAD(P)-binding domain-containing protein [Caldilineaceae bacterium]|nr:NAD(P)-binding domain-containing protein [Caldilineaceae bacterium]